MDNTEKDINFNMDISNKNKFSFEQIEPSLVFFNQDGESLSIISNCEKEDKEYKILKSLWNSQNPKGKNMLDLVNYKILNHDDFLYQIKLVFSLNKMDFHDLKKLCEDNDNYIFTFDNFIKMIRILLNIQAKIPVILMGETGIGKTKLLEMIINLYTHGYSRVIKLNIHAGIEEKQIIDFLEHASKEVKEQHIENELTFIIFDEINTCKSLGLITEIICNHTCVGKKLNDNFIFLGTCFPYRKISKKILESGLFNYDKKNKLVYNVYPLPDSLINFVFDFDSLEKDYEKMYIKNTIIYLLDKFKKEGKISNINNKDIINLKDEIINSIIICHDFIREKYDKSYICMRDLKRFGILYEYFLDYFKKSKSTIIGMKSSLNLTLYLVYYTKINDKFYKKDLCYKLKQFFDNFLLLPNREIKILAEKIPIEKRKGICFNRILTENLFTNLICIDNNIPLLKIGASGVGKSFSSKILLNVLQEDVNFLEEKIILNNYYYYHGSETNTAEGINHIFDKILYNKLKNKKEKKFCFLFFESMELTELSNNNPFKFFHYLLERLPEHSISFLGSSRWYLDPAIMSRVMTLNILDIDYNVEELIEIAIFIAELYDKELSIKYKEFLEILAKTYFEYIRYNMYCIKEIIKYFHGNMDYYALIKAVIRELMDKKNELNQSTNQNKILAEIAISCLNMNFGGLDYSAIKIKQIFEREFRQDFDKSFDTNNNFLIVNEIKKNLLDSERRYMMLISESNEGSFIIKYILDSINKKYIELVGSKFKNDLKSGIYIEEILNKIKDIMEKDYILLLKDLDIIYPSLYELFKQNFKIINNKRYIRIFYDYKEILSEVNENFRCIIIINKEQIKNFSLNIEFLHFFEKQEINFRMLLEEKDVNIAKKLYEFLEKISYLNNKIRTKKMDLKSLLINCGINNIEGLIFIIKNKLKIEQNDEKEYEKIIIKEIFKKIAPTFCQDIIVSLIYIKDELMKNYDEIIEVLIETYKEYRYNNFESFFRNINFKKNIIYTFSLNIENIFDNEKGIKNKFGLF